MIAEHFTAYVDSIEGRLQGLEVCVGILMAHVALDDARRREELIGILKKAAEDLRRKNDHPEKVKLLTDLAWGLEAAATRST